MLRPRRYRSSWVFISPSSKVGRYSVGTGRGLGGLRKPDIFLAGFLGLLCLNLGGGEIEFFFFFPLGLEDGGIKSL